MSLVRAIGFAAPLLLLSALGVPQEAVREYGRFAEVNGTQIYYEDLGEGEPLFLLHAFFGTASRWDPYVDGLATKYRVIVWDARGHGRSKLPEGSAVLTTDVAHDLLGLMDHLQITRAKGIGASLGGMALLYAATLAPDRFEALVTVGALPYYSVKARQQMTRAPFLENPEIVERLERSHGQPGAQQLARQFQERAAVYGKLALTPDLLATVSARVLIVQGDSDEMAELSQAVQMFRSIPRAHLWIVPNGTHLLHLDPANRDDFVRRATDFLEGQ